MTEQVTWTEGPWEVAESFSDDACCDIQNMRGVRIASILCQNDHSSSADTDEQEANARLIAASPEMAELLEESEMLEAIADEIDCFEHSARAEGLRSLAKRQRALLRRIKGSTLEN